MQGQFRGEAIYTAEVDVHFPQLTVGDTLASVLLVLPILGGKADDAALQPKRAHLDILLAG